MNTEDVSKLCVFPCAFDIFHNLLCVECEIHIDKYILRMEIPDLIHFVLSPYLKRNLGLTRKIPTPVHSLPILLL